MTLADLIEVARAYNDLGTAVQGQIDAVLDGRVRDCNRNALDVISGWLELVERSGLCSDEELEDCVCDARMEIERTLG